MSELESQAWRCEHGFLETGQLFANFSVQQLDPLKKSTQESALILPILARVCWTMVWGGMIGRHTMADLCMWIHADTPPVGNRNRIMIKAVLHIFCSLLLVSLPLGGMSADQVSETKDVKKLVQALDLGIEQVRTLDNQLDSVPEMDREAVMYRRDERTFALLQSLDELARAVASLPADDPLRQELMQRLRDESVQLSTVIFSRIQELSHRIAKLASEQASSSGAASLTIGAYILSLENQRIKAYQTAANLVESYSALGLPVKEMVTTLSRQLYLRAETLVGRLKFIGSAADQLQARLRKDPQNTELDAEVKDFAYKHAETLKRLQAVSNFLKGLGLDNTMYKSVLLQQGQNFSVRDFDSEVIFSLLQEDWVNLQQSLIEGVPDALLGLGVFVLVLLVFRALSRLTRRLVVAACERSGADMSTLLKDVLASVSSGTMMVIGVLIALSQLGISLGPMLAGLGVAGFIVGFALQDTLANFAAGGMILIYRPYDVDDFVEVAGASGLVKKMSLVSTTITTFDNQTLVVPNSKIWGDVIKNVTAQRVRRVDMEFGIGYSDDIEHAEKVLLDVIKNHALVLETPEPLIRLHTLGDSSVNFVVRPWVKTSDYWTVYWDVTRQVKLRFDQEGISIPFPQRDVHIHTGQA